MSKSWGKISDVWHPKEHTGLCSEAQTTHKQGQRTDVVNSLAKQFGEVSFEGNYTQNLHLGI